MKNNPFTLSFGKVPQFYINRPSESDTILSNFLNESPSIQTYLITGVRGSGKTSLLTYISTKLGERDDWIVIDLNPERDLLSSFASKLYEKGREKRLFLKSTLSLSLYGISLSFNNENPIVDPEIIIEKLVVEYKKTNRKILITIDEVNNSQKIKEFFHTYQALTRYDMPVFLLMSGLYENIKSIQDNKTLTFLYRAPSVDLKPLNLDSIAISYEDILKVDREDSIKLAKLTNGYAFAYQVLGYLLFEKGNSLIDESLLLKYSEYLNKYAYEKIFEDTPTEERKILFNIEKEGIDTHALLLNTGLNNQTYSVYRSRLIKKGILESKGYGKIGFTLPRFYEFLRLMEEFM